MALKIAASAAFFWPVVVQIATDGGRYEKQTFDVQFKRLTRSEVEDRVRKMGSEEITPVDFVREIVCGWKGVVDGDGQEVAFSETGLAELLEVGPVAKAILDSFTEATTGAARRKN